VYREIRLQGIGHQGAIAAGHIVGEAASLHEHKEALMIEDQNPYVVGGWSRADLIISDEPIDYPLVTKPDILVAMSQDGLDDNWRSTSKDATIVVESGLVSSQNVKGRKLFRVPALSIAEKLGKKALENIVILGFLIAKTGIVGRDAMKSVIANRDAKTVELGLQALVQGYQLAPEEESS
jgi:2-oxoglutarate ferredoxin oxidoreductase subunit gamma